MADALWAEWSPYVGFLDNWFQYWQTQGQGAPAVVMEPVTGLEVTPTSTLLGYRVAVIVKRYTTVNGGAGWATPDEDVAMVNIHFANYTGGSLDTSWTTSDFTSCEANLNTFFTAILGETHNHFLIDSLRWYSYGPGIISGPPFRITGVNRVGTNSANALPYQCATVCSLFTGLPRHRGRIYWPGLASTGMTAVGQLTSAWVTAFANAWETFLNSQHTAQLPVIVYDRAHGAIQSLTAGKVDSIIDIQRRRRPVTVVNQTVFPAS
jgi:hypothetical protein